MRFELAELMDLLLTIASGAAAKYRCALESGQVTQHASVDLKTELQKSSRLIATLHELPNAKRSGTSRYDVACQWVKDQKIRLRRVT